MISLPEVHYSIPLKDARAGMLPRRIKKSMPI